MTLDTNYDSSKYPESTTVIIRYFYDTLIHVTGNLSMIPFFTFP